MKKNILNELGKRIVFFDGGMGTLLQERGLEAGELPENWNLKHPDIIRELHRDYLNAGADIILANTFGANELKFPDNLEEIVTKGVQNAKKAVEETGKDGYVALDVGPTGKLLKPLGTLDFEDAVSIFARTIKAGAAAGADLILIETMSDTYELKAAMLAAKENSDLPVMATVIFGENGKMLTGATPEAVTALLEGLGADAFGMNCGLGPKQMKPIFERLAKSASIPLIINPNAGLPRSENGKTVFDVDPAEFAEDMKIFAEEGAWLMGGCCGTTPAHIKALVEACKDAMPKPLTDKNLTLVSSYSHAVELGKMPMLIGERINPTGKSKFKQALRDRNMEYILEMGVKQSDAGAQILDVNVGLPEINEPELMKETVYQLQSILDAPLQIDTTNMEAMEQALRIYNGKPMINSVNGKQEIMKQVFPLAKKYGGVVVGLALDEDGIPDTVEGRLAIAEKIYKTGESYGIARKDIVIDALTMTMSTDSNSANVTLETVRRIKAQGGRTVLGVSNISFGLPERQFVNTAFLTMAIAQGLTMAIANPSQTLLTNAALATDLLLNKTNADLNYINGVNKAEISTGNSANRQSSEEDGHPLYLAVVKGKDGQALALAKEEIEKGEKPGQIIDSYLIPAINHVGELFEKGTYFLPQLIASAEAMEKAIDYLEPYLAKERGDQKLDTIVMATVKGDIHDIGKNLVVLMLKNYGYDVIDLGKDVDNQLVIDTAIKENAAIIGLSALMTTTMTEMKEVVDLAKAQGVKAKIIIGGAVVTESYAEEIGADGYSKDAREAVKLVNKLLGR